MKRQNTKQDRDTYPAFCIRFMERAKNAAERGIDEAVFLEKYGTDNIGVFIDRIFFNKAMQKARSQLKLNGQWPWVKQVFEDFDVDLFEFPHGRDYAIGAIKRLNGADFARAGYSNHVMLDAVLVNWQPLSDRGMLPAALIESLTGCKYQNGGWPPAFIESKLLSCAMEFGLESLRCRGDEFDYTDGDRKLTLYRGVAGPARMRNVSGISWTDDLDIACWFAMKFVGNEKKPDPAVYMANDCVGNVFCYTNQRGEREFIIRPKRPRRLPLTCEEMLERAKKPEVIEKV